MHRHFLPKDYQHVQPNCPRQYDTLSAYVIADPSYRIGETNLGAQRYETVQWMMLNA